MDRFNYQWGRDRRRLNDGPPPARFAAGIARCLSPQRTATFKYLQIPFKRMNEFLQPPTRIPPGWARRERLDLSSTGDERQRQFDQSHEEIDRSVRHCKAWFSHPWLTEERVFRGTLDLGWRSFERPYKMGHVTAVLQEDKVDVLGDRLVRVLPGAVRDGRTKKMGVVVKSES